MFSALFVAVTVVVAGVVNGQSSVRANHPLHIQITQPGNSLIGCVSASTSENGSEVEIEDCRRTFPSSYTWSLTKSGGVSGQIRLFGNKCLDVTNGLNQNGNKLQVWACSEGNTNQLWIPRSDGSFNWAGTNKCLDLTDGVLMQNTPLQIWECVSGNTNQKWTTVEVDPLVEQIHHFSDDASASLVITASSNARGSPVIVANITSSPPMPSVPISGYGPIRMFGDKCLDVTNGANADGTKVQLWDCVEGNTNQLWSINRGGASNGADVIQWVGSNKCLDITNGKLVNGTQLQIWTCGSSNTNQQWSLAPDF